jgi:hypothetical protein
MSLSLLKITEGGNAKLPSYIIHMSLPSGYSCPGACKCLCRADPDSGKMTHGKDATHRCFSATQEAAFPSVREQRWHNFSTLLAAGSKAAMRDLILRSLPKDFLVMRLHIGGDFFSQAYFDAWMEVAAQRPKSQFYAYTKSLKFWAARYGEIPSNFRLVASYGGTHDHLIKQFDLPHAIVVFHPDEANRQGLTIDHDDSLARDPAVEKFALLLHGQQPAGSPAAAALAQLRAEKVEFGYARAQVSAELQPVV